MDPDRLESVIHKIRAVSANKGTSIPLFLSKKISSIKKAFEECWKSEDLSFATKIAAVIGEGIPTPVLTVCGRGTQEIRFTRYLAYFLDPQKNHGLGTLLLRSIFDREAREFGLPENWVDNCSVIPEIWLGSYFDQNGEGTDCISDIGIVGDDFAIIIEQKILSGEGPADGTGLTQLNRYSEAIKGNHAFDEKKIIKIYLTPAGKEKEGINDWLGMSHLEIIKRAWRCLADTEISKAARENLRRLLMDLVLGPYNETEELIMEIEAAALSITVAPVDFQELVKFRRMVKNNRLLIDLLMEES